MNKMSLQKSIQNFGIKQALKYMEKDPEENIPKLMDMVDKFAPDGWYEAQRNMIRKVIKERGNWYQLILRIYQLDPEVRKAFFQNFIFNASLKGSALQEQLAEENNCNIPWAILLDPTSACNLHRKCFVSRTLFRRSVWKDSRQPTMDEEAKVYLIKYSMP